MGDRKPLLHECGCSEPTARGAGTSQDHRWKACAFPCHLVPPQAQRRAQLNCSEKAEARGQALSTTWEGSQLTPRKLEEDRKARPSSGGQSQSQGAADPGPGPGPRRKRQEAASAEGTESRCRRGHPPSQSLSEGPGWPLPPGGQVLTHGLRGSSKSPGQRPLRVCSDLRPALSHLLHAYARSSRSQGRAGASVTPCHLGTRTAGKAQGRAGQEQCLEFSSGSLNSSCPLASSHPHRLPCRTALAF